jgi:hypothetical protein
MIGLRSGVHNGVVIAYIAAWLHCSVSLSPVSSMAARGFTKILISRVFITGASISAAVIVGNELRRAPTITPASSQFYTSSLHPIPPGWTGWTWKIRNDYPSPTPSRSTTPSGHHLPTCPDSPWMSINFKTNPLMYCEIIKEYCWEGNSNNGFIVQRNTVRFSAINAYSQAHLVGGFIDRSEIGITPPGCIGVPMVVNPLTV